MTAEEIRDLGYLKWRDPWAWMETMKGKRWENHIKREKEHFNELANQYNVQKEARQMEKEVKYAQQYSILPPFKIGCGTIDIVPNASKFNWKWSWSKKSKTAYDIDIQGNIVWYVTSDEDSKDYKNELICESADGKVIWRKKAVSSQIAIVGDLCYFVKVVDYFTTVELCVCNAHTGNEENVIYREKDKKRDLVLVKGANRALYLISSSPLYDILYKVKDDKIIQMSKSSMLQMPLGESIYGDDCILVKKTKKDKWIAIGKPVNKWKLPEEEIQWVNLQSGMFLTIFEGAQSIWYCSENTPKLLFRIKVGTVDPNIWTTWENALVQTFTVKTPSEVPFMINIINNKVYRDERKIKIENPVTFPQLEIHKFHTISKDGTKVPYITLFEKGVKPKAQFIYVYGAYGSTTPVGWPFTNWYPLIKRKWAIVFAFVRGGGDIDSAWTEMARRENRHVVVDDFEAVIRDSQRKLKLGPNETVIFGRSAGGLPVGAIVSRFPDGELVGAAFTEVPYVDVLRTSSNPDLPLTIGEFDEFGNPLERMINFKELLSVSPVNTLPTDGAPGVFVMSRVGLVDKQVFAYESFKWIQKLRGFAAPDNSNMSDAKGKYVTFERDEAHHYRASKFPRFRAIDLAILDTWVDGKLKL